MGDCPFCGTGVAEDLVLYGGTCPHCFGEIPGEEAATDPGDEVKAKIDASDRRRAFYKALIPVGLALPVVGALALFALFLVLRPEPEVALMDFDGMDEFYVPEFVGVAEDDPAEDEKIAALSRDPDAEVEPLPSSPRRTPSGGSLLGGAGAESVGGGADALANLTQRGEVAEGGLKGPREAAGGAQTPDGLVPDNLGGGISDGDNPLSLGSMATSVTRRAPLLEDPEQVREHIWKVMKTELPRLKSCYDRALKTQPDLSGKWRLSYVVTKEGRVVNATATGLTSKAPELESCFASQISKWKFYRLANNQPVQRSVTFRPAR